MSSSMSLALLCSVALFGACQGLQQDLDGLKDAPKLKLPTAYEAKFTFSIPYTAQYLPSYLEYPVHMWVNKEKRLVRMDVNSDEYVAGVKAWGLDSSISKNGALYFRTPRLNEYTCLVSASSEQVHIATKGVTNLLTAMHETSAPALGRKLLQAKLPGFSKWEFQEYMDWRGVKAEKWTYKHKIEERVSHYEVIVSVEEELLYLRTLGSEYTTGAHFDEYIMDFSSFKELDADDEAPFDLPPECYNTPLEQGVQSMALALAALAPDSLLAPTDFAEFSERHGRQHRNDAERRQRAHAYVHHSMTIKRHNLRAGRGYTLAENRYTDWLEPEFSHLLGFKRDPQATAAVSAVMHGNAEPGGTSSKFEHTMGGTDLPENFDWRGTGAVGVVKDQGVCGSCWSFSAAQVLASAQFMATGEFVSLSEQQIMDCAWKYGYGQLHNQACDGGWPELGVKYTIEHGGSFEEKDYPYQGVDDFCRAQNGQLHEQPDAKPAFRASGLKFVERYNREAVKEALVKYGPLSIGVDAEPIPFRFYSSGVLDTEECSSAPANIDHAVLLVGYGVEDGMDYWLVKNEWSAHWGDAGYIKVAQEHDCAVATEAFFVTP
eukprot:jgi/Ulvmu1/4311/UM002_0032.1